MSFPWRRFWRRVAVVFVVALAFSLVVATALANGRLSAATAVVAVVDSAVLAIVLAFPLTQRIYRGPRPPR